MYTGKYLSPERSGIIGKSRDYNDYCCLWGSDQKQPRKCGDIIFPIISRWGLSVAMEIRVLIQYAPKPYAAVPYPNDATHKISSRLVNWLHRYSSSKVWNFRHSGASNSKMSGLIRPKIEFDRPFMSVLVTSNFDDDWIQNERASMETPFSHYIHAISSGLKSVR